MKDELKEVFELADDLRSKVKKIIKKSKVDPDKVDYKVLPPGYEIIYESGGYYHSKPGTDELSDTIKSHQAAIASAWAYYADSLNERIENLESGLRLITGTLPAYKIIQDILAERKRLEVNGFTLDQDRNGVFSDAAAALLLYEQEIAEDIWPFDSEFDPKDHRDNFVRAGALIIAEIERLDRLASKEPDHE